MNEPEDITSMTKKIIAIISIHTIILIAFSYAQEKIDLMYNLTIYYPVLLILMMLPLLAIPLLLSKLRRQGTIILLGVFPAEIFYNIYKKFFNGLPFNILEPELTWKIIYEISFGIMLITEAIGFWVVLGMLKEIHKQPSN